MTGGPGRHLAGAPIEDNEEEVPRQVLAPGTFRRAVEAKNLTAITRTLHPAIEFHSPVMVKPYRGREQVTTLIRILLQILEDFHYTDELVETVPRGLGTAGAGDVPAQALVFTARVMGKTVQGLDLIKFNDAGLVTSLTVMVRPLPAAMTLARAVGRQMDELAASA